jgi:ankyrin repeat protein
LDRDLANELGEQAAANKGLKNAVDLLTNIDNINYGCPLSYAVDSAGNFQLVELLLDYGPDIGLKQDTVEPSPQVKK